MRPSLPLNIIRLPRVCSIGLPNTSAARNILTLSEHGSMSPTTTLLYHTISLLTPPPDHPTSTTSPDADPSVYLCGNSLGLQPRRVSARLHQFLSTWATQGVQGHFKRLTDSPLPAWLHADDAAAKAMAPIVGAAPAEIAVMETLTANLHFILSAFYRPQREGRHKIIIESKAFPSDHVSTLCPFPISSWHTPYSATPYCVSWPN